MLSSGPLQGLPTTDPSEVLASEVLTVARAQSAPKSPHWSLAGPLPWLSVLLLTSLGQGRTEPGIPSPLYFQGSQACPTAWWEAEGG